MISRLLQKAHRLDALLLADQSTDQFVPQILKQLAPPSNQCLPPTLLSGSNQKTVGSRLGLVGPFAGVAAGQRFAQVIHVELRVVTQRVEGLVTQKIFNVIQISPNRNISRRG
jgi:hypothetical protein